MNNQLCLFDLLPLNLTDDPYEIIKPPTPEIIYRLYGLKGVSSSSIHYLFLGKIVPPIILALPKPCFPYSQGPHHCPALPYDLQPPDTWHLIIQDLSIPKRLWPDYYLIKPYHLKKSKK